MKDVLMERDKGSRTPPFRRTFGQAAAGTKRRFTVVGLLRRFSVVTIVMSCIACTVTGELGLDTAPPSSTQNPQSHVGIGFGSTDMVYAGEVVEDALCIWVDTGGGNLVSLRWPAGSVAKRNPLRVESPSGQVLARVGDHLTGQGGGSELAEPGCHAGAMSAFLSEEF